MYIHPMTNEIELTETEMEILEALAELDARGMAAISAVEVTS